MKNKMKNKMKIISLLLLGTASHVTMAVQTGSKGLGEVLIYPYYTVNSNLNTLYSVVNTTPDTKAIAVHFLEGDISLETLAFNVYLGAYDVWTGVLIPATSTLPEHIGEPSAVHITNDTSCAPFLIKAGQEFLPYVIDTDLDADNRSMQRATEGHIEIIEMATFNDAAFGTVAWAHHSAGVPTNCAAIQADWGDNGVYDTADEAVPSGGLLGSASIVNVGEGIAFSYDAIALENFWQGPGMHTDPSSLEPNLNAAFPESTVLLDNGQLVKSEWSHGFQAVSAVLTKDKVINEYALDAVVFGRTEWVMSFPTKGFHSNSGDDVLLAPFTESWDGLLACDQFELELWDREATDDSSTCCAKTSPRPPGGVGPKMCKASNALAFIHPGAPAAISSAILGTEDHLSVTGPSFAVTENGWAKLDFPLAQPNLPLSGDGFKGLPVIGFAVQQYTNAGAAEGLLAQYGTLFKHKHVIEIESPE